MPTSYYSSNVEQPQLINEPVPTNQMRSNSMADAMNFSQFKGFNQDNLGQGGKVPPGLVKKTHSLGDNLSSVDENQSLTRAISDADNDSLVGTQESTEIRPEFVKMSISAGSHISNSGRRGTLRAATGEVSCHSNSTIKEEENDSERDGYDGKSDTSSNKTPLKLSSKQKIFEPKRSNFNPLVDDDYLRNQKRRESQQIPITSLEDKKIIKSPMKSTSLAFVPKHKDNRGMSMPNIFNPIGNKEQPYGPNQTQDQPAPAYYQFGSQPPQNPLLGMGSGRMPIKPTNNVSRNSQVYTTNTQTKVNSLIPPMADYNYDERRNSGTTGGSTNLLKSNQKFVISNGKNKKTIQRSTTGPYGNRGRRSSQTTSNLIIPTNDKNVMDYKGQIVAFAKNQQGSKYLQRVLAKASPDILEFVVIEVGDHLHELMVDSYGNYFCQKLLQSSSSKQRLYLLTKISTHIFKISCDKRGTHSMQSLIQLINMEEEEETLEKAIIEHVIDLGFDPNGTHVLQKIILTVKEEKLDYIFYPCFEKLTELALDSNGLCVIKKIITRFNTPEKRELLISKLSENCVQLVQSPYGNYAIQQAIDHWSNEELHSVYTNLYDNLLQLSMQKFSSNVIEKVLDRADDEMLVQYAESLTEDETMKSLVKSNYGFYVIQKLMSVTSHMEGYKDKIMIVDQS